jgi:hypothetical protein
MLLIVSAKCYLSYGNMNPEVEEDICVIAIKEIAYWLGSDPYQITHSGDNFGNLSELAEKLIDLPR